MGRQPKVGRRELLEVASIVALGAPTMGLADTVSRRLDWPLAEDFAAILGDDVLLTDEGGNQVRAALIEVSESRHTSPVGFRKGFSTVFRLPAGFRRQQAVYLIEHPSLGRIQLLLVPITPPEGAPLLEGILA